MQADEFKIPEIDAPWVRVIGRPPILKCLRCGLEEKLPKTLGTTDRIRRCTAFALVHVNCAEPDSQ